MSNPRPAPKLQQIPLDAIEVMNPRERNTKVFREIVANIRTLGLKKPITVTPRPVAEGEPPRYLLVCGEGRLRAFRELGQTEIPALVVDVNDEDAMIMSLAENITRRLFRPLELLAAIERLHTAGYDARTIAEKTGLSHEYVHGILTLLRYGEERLLAAVEAGKIPLTAALAIVHAGDNQVKVQGALQDAYESGKLRGKQLLQAKRLVERRQMLGHSLARRMSRKTAEVSSHSIVRTYQREVARQRALVRKSNLAQAHLMFFVGAMNKLLTDDHFATLLRAERLETLPKFLAERVRTGGTA